MLIVRPSSNYILSAACLAFSLGLLVGYPAAAIHSRRGFAPNDELWIIMAVSTGIIFTIYSLIPKPAWLMCNNFAILPFAYFILYEICYSINPTSVGENTGQLIFFAIFTAGSPFWLPIAFFSWHMIACLKIATPEKKD